MYQHSAIPMNAPVVSWTKVFYYDMVNVPPLRRSYAYEFGREQYISWLPTSNAFLNWVVYAHIARLARHCPTSQASTSGDRVPARGGHSCVLADFQLVIYGGTFYKGDVRGYRECVHIHVYLLHEEDNIMHMRGRIIRMTKSYVLTSSFIQ